MGRMKDLFIEALNDELSIEENIKSNSFFIMLMSIAVSLSCVIMLAFNPNSYSLPIMIASIYVFLLSYSIFVKTNKKISELVKAMEEENLNK